MPDLNHNGGKPAAMSNPGEGQGDAPGIAVGVGGVDGKVGKGGADVVMTARRTWTIGASIGLSRGYTFVPGVRTRVSSADADLLTSRAWDDRTFSRAD